MVVKYSQDVLKLHWSWLKEANNYLLVFVLFGICFCVSFMDYRFFVCLYVLRQFYYVGLVGQARLEITDTYLLLPPKS